MPVSDDYLRSLLPASQQAMGMQSVQPTQSLGGSPLVPGPDPNMTPLAGPPMPDPGTMAGPPTPAPGMQNGAFPTGGRSLPDPNQSIANMSVDMPPAPPPPQGGVAQGLSAMASPVAKLIASHGAGTGAHEVNAAGPQQQALIAGAEAKREGGLEKAATLQTQSQDIVQQEANKRAAEADTEMLASQKTQAANQQRIDNAGKKYSDAAKGLESVPFTDMWSDMGGGAKVLSILSAGIGALGAGFSHGPNYAQQAIDSAMSNDLKLKQARFGQQVAKKDAAQQGFDNLVRQIGMDPAKDVYAAAQRQKLAAQAQALGAASAKPEIQAALAGKAADLSAAADEYKAKGMLKFIPASGPTTTYTDPNIGIPMTRTEALKHRQGQEAAATEQAGKLELEGVKEGKKAQGREDENTRFIAEKMQTAGIPHTLESVDAAQRALEGGNTSGLGIPGLAVKSVLGDIGYNAIFGDKATHREQDWGMVKSQIMKSITGAGMSDKERERYDSMLEGAGDDKSRIHALSEARKAVQAQADSIKAGAGIEAAKRFDQNMKSLERPAIKTRKVAE